MYAANSIRDAYRKLKKDNADYLLAFGQGEFFMFVLGDADKVVAALPDTPRYYEVDYSAVRIHSMQIFQFALRLNACGLKVAMVARHVAANNKVRYQIETRSDD